MSISKKDEPHISATATSSDHSTVPKARWACAGATEFTLRGQLVGLFLALY
jgi:hypothetical protein